MRKIHDTLIAAVLAGALSLTGCGSDGQAASTGQYKLPENKVENRNPANVNVPAAVSALIPFDVYTDTRVPVEIADDFSHVDKGQYISSASGDSIVINTGNYRTVDVFSLYDGDKNAKMLALMEYRFIQAGYIITTETSAVEESNGEQYGIQEHTIGAAVINARSEDGKKIYDMKVIMASDKNGNGVYISDIAPANSLTKYTTAELKTLAREILNNMV